MAVVCVKLIKNKNNWPTLSPRRLRKHFSGCVYDQISRQDSILEALHNLIGASSYWWIRLCVNCWEVIWLWKVGPDGRKWVFVGLGNVYLGSIPHLFLYLETIIWSSFLHRASLPRCSASQWSRSCVSSWPQIGAFWNWKSNQSFFP